MRHVLVALTLLFCALPGEAARRRAVSPADGCIASISAVPCMLAFVSERDGNSEIYVINVDGTGLMRLTDNIAHDLEPAWSPDGKRIAFASDRSGDSDIYIMDADGSNLVRRTQSGSSGAPAWSPDGKKIAYSSWVGGQLGIYVISADGEWDDSALVGYNRGFNTHPSWSPDGTRIAFVSDWRAFDFVYDIYVMSADGSGITSLIEGPFFGPWIYYFQPSFSPDGGKLAVVVCPRASNNCYTNSSIAIANSDGSGLKTLVETKGFGAPTWSPDGSAIAFSSQACQSCVGELRYASTDGSKSGVIFSNGHDPAWRP